MTTTASPLASPALHLTAAAAHKVYQLIEEEKNPQLNLRIYINGGGCHGFQYAFTFDDTVRPNDQIIETHVSSDGVARSVRLLVDYLSLPYLQNAEIDYREDVNGTQFIVRNPNAKTTCGCGSSFAA
ncbi:MAG: iron-sulfur cluster insertion protein ErpA [Coxiella sp. RIFCSPHIGHO2_12_FULL_44_14]|nr:MAG: iron-sulfur cluster insertion protein ErpA [Coxiella sp. RIFCSPHIGHO2_12_FULL_44_14]